MNFFNNMFNNGNQGNGPNRPHPSNPLGGMSNHQRRLHQKGVATLLDMLPAYPGFYYGRTDIENGNKILLPQRILEEITNKNAGQLPYPMIFSISSLQTKKTYFVGVLEFTAPEQTVILPFWLFRNMRVAEGEMIRIGYCKYLPKANFCKIRPHKTAFIELADPKTILEMELRKFVCLNLNDTITIEFNGKQYDLDIIELKPANNYKAAVIIDTDLTLDFAPPLDYVEPVRKKVASGKTKQVDESGVDLSRFRRLDGKKLKKRQKKRIINEELEKEYDPRKHRIENGIRKNCLGIFKKFKGTGVRLGSN
jgi:ubiquitin fusion degradation protein 1